MNFIDPLPDFDVRNELSDFQKRPRLLAFLIAETEVILTDAADHDR